MCQLADSNKKLISISMKQNDDGYFEFVVPKKWCKVSIPRVLSDEEKQALREKMLKVNAARFS